MLRSGFTGETHPTVSHNTVSHNAVSHDTVSHLTVSRPSVVSKAWDGNTMAKLNSETLAGVGHLDVRGQQTDSPANAPAHGTVEASPPRAQAAAETPFVEADHRLTTGTQPGLGGNTPAPAGHQATSAHATGPTVGRSGTHVRVSTQNGSSVRPGAPIETRESLSNARVTTPEPARPAPAWAHDTLRGVGKNETPSFSRTLPFAVAPRRTEIAAEASADAVVDIDVYTSAPGITLPFGTRLPKALLDAAPTPKFRGFATNPPVTPKVLARHLDAYSTTEPRISDSAQVDVPPAPITPRAKRPLAEPRSPGATDVPRAPNYTERSTPAPPVAQRSAEETFRPSAHTTPPGVPELPAKRRRFTWLLAAFPLATMVALTTVELSGNNTVQGAVVLEGGSSHIVNGVAGPVARVLVEPGAIVTAGQTLVELDASNLDERRASLQAREAALLAERERASTLGAKWHNAATEALQRKRGLLWKRLELRRSRTSANGSDQLDVDRDAELLIRQELADVEFELNRRESDRDDQLQGWEQRMNDLKLALSQVNNASTVVRAPVAGRIEALMVGPGEVLTEASPVARLVPNDAARELVLLVPTRLAQSLSVGSELPVNLEPGSSATVPARVTSIDDADVSGETIAELVGSAATEPVVRVEVELVSPESSPASSASLRPGAGISALVPGPRQPLWRHLLRDWGN